MSDTRTGYASRWMAPQDGGRGREIRRRWSCIRWFSWRYGTAWRRSHRTFVTLTWHLFYGYEVLFGLTTFEDEDGYRNVHIGFWPLHLSLTWTPWARPDALGWQFGEAEDNASEDDWTEGACQPMTHGCTGAPHRPSCPEHSVRPNESGSSVASSPAPATEVGSDG